MYKAKWRFHLLAQHSFLEVARTNPALGSSLGLPKSRKMDDVFYFGMSSIEISFFSIIPFIFNPKN